MSRVCVITGGSGALGSAVVEAAAAKGLRVVTVDRRAGRANPKTALALSGVDLSKPADADKAMAEAAAKLGGIDALLNIAGGFTFSDLASSSPETWLSMYSMNCLSAGNACRAALPHLKKSDAGRIVNVGANGALKAGSGMGPYAASKSAVHRLTESLAAELLKTNVTVNAVLPSTIDTQANRESMKSADFSKWVKPGDLAEVMLFLASPQAGAITGALIPVTGRV